MINLLPLLKVSNADSIEKLVSDDGNCIALVLSFRRFLSKPLYLFAEKNKDLYQLGAKVISFKMNYYDVEIISLNLFQSIESTAQKTVQLVSTKEILPSDVQQKVFLS